MLEDHITKKKEQLVEDHLKKKGQQVVVTPTEGKLLIDILAAKKEQLFASTFKEKRKGANGGY